MDWKILVMGFVLLAAGAYAHGADISGTCSSDSIQCDLSLSNMELCNDSSQTHTYNSFFQSNDVSSWFNVIPDSVTLAPGECTELNVYTVANCYAEPGLYTAELIVQNNETISVTCELDLRQGHFVNIEVIPIEQNATQCEEKTYDLVVTNNTIVENQNTERIDITISGLPDEWYTLEEERILVDKGDSETVKLKVQAPCDADFGTYEFTARAALPNPEFYDEDNGTYILGQGQNAHITLGNEFEGNSIEACLETPTEGKIIIKNSGKLADNYTITLEGANFASLDKKQVSLDAGKETTVTVKFDETAMEPGEYDYTLKVQSKVFDYSATKTFTAQLNDCYNLEVKKLAGSNKVCVEETPTYKWEITNNKTRTVDLDIKVKGIDADLEYTKLSLAPGKSKIFQADLDVSSLASEAQVSGKDLAVELIIDSSGSMVEKVSGKTKMNVAKESIINLVNNINEIDLGLRVFGQGELCENSELLVPVEKLDIEAITDKVSNFEPKGKTPLSEALTASITDFPTGKEKAIILVSDGKETCDGDIADTATKLAAKNIRVYSVGFDIDEAGKKQLQQISSATAGKYFDAKDPAELIEVLQKISKELDIVPSKGGESTFTLELDSEFFQYEKDYTVEVTDCYNATMVAPELNLCPGVSKQEIITLTNLGTENQVFELNFSPLWVTGPSEVTVDALGETAVSITVNSPQNKETTAYTVSANSGNVEIEQEKSVNYLSDSSCFGIDLIVVVPELNAATCEGKKQILIVENRGVVAQEVTFTADKPYVYIVDKTITVEPGERKEVTFFVNPPFDLETTTTIKFTAVTDRGFETGATIKLIVFGNEESFGLGEVNIEIQDLSFIEVEGLDHDIEVNFDLYNDSNRTMEVQNATVLDYKGVVQIEEQYIQARSTAKARVLVDLQGQEKSGTITVPIKIETDEGTFVRNIVFEFPEKAPVEGEPIEGETENPISIGTGLFSLATLSTAALGFLVLLVIGLIILSAYKAVQKEEKQEEVVEAPAKTETKEKGKTASKAKTKKTAKQKGKKK